METIITGTVDVGVGVSMGVGVGVDGTEGAASEDAVLFMPVDWNVIEMQAKTINKAQKVKNNQTATLLVEDRSRSS